MVTECLDSKTFSSGDQKWYHTAWAFLSKLS
jgi:hypothetical protein